MRGKINFGNNEIIDLKKIRITDYHLSHSDIEIDGDDYNDAHEYIMNQVINRFIQK